MDFHPIFLSQAQGTQRILPLPFSIESAAILREAAGRAKPSASLNFVSDLEQSKCKEEQEKTLQPQRVNNS